MLFNNPFVTFQSYLGLALSAYILSRFWSLNMLMALWTFGLIPGDSAADPPPPLLTLPATSTR